MALQHLYSRVPAKVSLFNRVDGYDTFACSDGISREFIDKELELIDLHKPTPDETNLIKKGELSPVYCQYPTKSGELIQSCMSYITRDYTGERTAYLVHSLILKGEELEKVVGTADKATLERSMFEKDISVFDITGSVKFGREYPEAEYIAVDDADPAILADMADPSTCKRFIFSLLGCLTNKPKSIYIIIDEKENISEKALDMVNAIMQMLPYHLRPYLSFLTRITDISKMGSIKLKFIPSTLPELPASRGASFCFPKKYSNGVKDEEVAKNITVVDFFYSLLRDQNARHEFLDFANKAVKAVPELASPQLKTITELVMLFRCSCGLYEQNTVLPNDDRMGDYFTVYEKYRNALNEEYRVTGIKSLRRYSTEHIAIPKTVFAKLTKVYPTDSIAVKHIIMSVVLELIHTDAMRDKIFAFVKSNYPHEDEETRDKINTDFSRVFYGGFLQEQILAFFDAYFDKESVISRDAIAEKLFLTVRTPEIQNKVAEFIEKHYDAFTEESKVKLYDAILEELPDGDSVTELLLKVANAHLPKEDESFKDDFLKRFEKVILTEQRRESRPLIALVACGEGLCTDYITKKVFSEWSGKKIFAEFISYTCRGPVAARFEKILYFWDILKDLPKNVSDRFINAAYEAFVGNNALTDIVAVLDSNREMFEKSAEDGEAAAKFAYRVSEKVVLPFVKTAMLDVFKHRDKIGSAEKIIEYASVYPEVAEAADFPVFEKYIAAKTAAVNGEAYAFIDAISCMPEDKNARKIIGSYMQADLIDSKAMPECETKTLVSLVLNVFRTGSYGFNLVYEAYSSVLAGETPENEKKSDAQKRIFNAESKAFVTVVTAGNFIFASHMSDEYDNLLVAPNSGLGDIVGSVIRKWKSQGEKLCLTITAGLRPSGSEYVKAIQKAVKSAKPKPLAGVTDTFKKIGGKIGDVFGSAGRFVKEKIFRK